MPMNTYEVSCEQARSDIVATNSSAPSPRDRLPIQLKVNVSLLQVRLDKMQIDERG